MVKLLSLASLVVLASATIARADSFTFTTPVGATTSGPVNASATVVTGLHTITITLTDLQANPGDVAQLISDFGFTLGPCVGCTTASISSASAQEISIDNHVGTVGSTVTPGWQLETISGGFKLDALNGAPSTPSELIIGPGPFTNAGGSINGNGPHNPFLNQTATWTLADLGVTSNTQVTGVYFSFGTTAGTEIIGVPKTPQTPEPSSLMLLGTGIVGAAGMLRRRMLSGSARA